MKKGEIGWSFVVKLIIGLLVLGALILMAVKSKGGFMDLFSKIKDIF